MANVTELNRKPDISANAIDAAEVSATDRLDGPTYPTRSDVPDEDGFYAVEDVDGEGNFGVIYREVT